jgi:hypothetical protein
MAAAGIPDSPKGRQVAVLTLLDVAATLITDEKDGFALRDYFAYACQKDEAAKQGIITDLLGADVVREEHTHFVVNFEPETSA